MEDEQAARDNVKRLARIRGLTMKALAEAAGLSASTVYNWMKESNPHSLGAGALSAIAETLEVDVEHLFDYNRLHGPQPEEQARQRILRQIDAILGALDDPQEQDRAGALILATLRAYQDGYERQRAAQPGPRRAGVGPTPGPTARHPGAP